MDLVLENAVSPRFQNGIYVSNQRHLSAENECEFLKKTVSSKNEASLSELHDKFQYHQTPPLFSAASCSS